MLLKNKLLVSFPTIRILRAEVIKDIYHKKISTLKNLVNRTPNKEKDKFKAADIKNKKLKQSNSRSTKI